MRGILNADFPTPTSGLLLNIPTYQVPPSGLLGGSNMLLDIDGYYRPRAGYQPWYVGSNPNEALLGLVNYIDTDGSYQYVGVGSLQVWALIGSTWTPEGGNLHGSPDYLASIIPFLQPWIDGKSTPFLSTIIANGQDPLKIWNQSLAAAQNLTPIHAAGSGNTLVVNTTPTFASAYPIGNPGPQWYFTVTSGNTGNTTLNINSIGAQPLMYVNSSGVLSQLPSGYLKAGHTYNVSWDGTEFVLGTNLPAPTAVACFALNDRIVAVNVTTGGVTVPSQVAWSSTFDAAIWPALAFQNLVDTDDTLIAGLKIGLSSGVVYGSSSAYLIVGVEGAGDANAFTFTPINGLAEGEGPTSSLAVMNWSGGHMWLSRSGRIWTTDGINAVPLTSAIAKTLQNQINFLYKRRIFTLDDSLNRRKWWFVQTNNTTTSTAVVIQLDPQPYVEVLQTFPTLFTAATVAVRQSGVEIIQLTNAILFYTQPINSFGSGFDTVNLASDSKAVHLFGSAGGSKDGGYFPVQYSFTPGLITQGYQLDVRPESFDLFVQLGQVLELATLQFDWLQYPDDPGMTGLAALVNWSDPLTFTMPQVDPTMSNYARYLRVTLSGYSTARQLAFGGMRIYLNQLGRPSQNQTMTLGAG